jgi:hypothetical protein
MRRASYRDHHIVLASEPTPSGGWIARATVIIGAGKTAKTIPIFGRRRAAFESRRQADAYALELAKLWIDGRFWGANGRG